MRTKHPLLAFLSKRTVSVKAVSYTHLDPPARELKEQPLTPFYLYWLISLRKLNTVAGRASRPEFWSFFLLSVLLFLPLGYSLIAVDSQPAGFYVSPSLQIRL